MDQTHKPSCIVLAIWACPSETIPAQPSELPGASSTATRRGGQTDAIQVHLPHGSMTKTEVARSALGGAELPEGVRDLYEKQASGFLSSREPMQVGIGDKALT